MINKLTNKDLKKIIKESVHSLMLEWEDDASRNNDFQLSSQYTDLSQELSDVKYQLDGVINEFPRFISLMQECAKKFGLTYKNSMVDSFCDMSDISDERTKTFEYTYALLGYDVNNLSDEEYEALEDRMTDIESEIRLYIRDDEFQFGKVDVYAINNEIEFSYEFQINVN